MGLLKEGTNRPQDEAGQRSLVGFRCQDERTEEPGGETSAAKDEPSREGISKMRPTFCPVTS
jgi:hypothetical protein